MAVASRRTPAVKRRIPQRVQPKSSLKLTDEQIEIRDAARAKDDLIIQACAGSGKSSTLREIALDQPGRKFLYVVYNTAAREDAEKKFPKNVLCQPDGTKVMVPLPHTGQGNPPTTEIPIEKIEVGDQVVSWYTNVNSPMGLIRKKGKKVVGVTRRTYRGQLIEVTSENHTSRYTMEHPCMVRTNETFSGKHLVYLMKRGDYFKIGYSKWDSLRSTSRNCLATRIHQEDPDALWILGSYETRVEGLTEEKLAQHRWNIPGFRFRNEKGQDYDDGSLFDTLWHRVGPNKDKAEVCLTSVGRHIDHPFWSRGDSTGFSYGVRMTAACNLMDGMKVLVASNAQRVMTNTGRTETFQTPMKVWTPVMVKREYFEGQVTSLEVEDDHTYFADGILTHNCKTRHSLAYGAIGWKYRDRNRKGRMPSTKLAQRLKILKTEEYPGIVEPHVFKPGKLASLALETVSVFCSSDDERILPEHVPYQKGLSRAAQRDLSSKVAQYASRFWLETIRPKSDLWFADDYYFKIWLMSNPTLPYDAIMLDEAQDSTMAVRKLILSQHTQKIAVGDSAQSLYRWQGAVNIMDGWPGKELYLTMSFRFGDAIAEEANLWLEHTGTKLRVQGNPAVTSRVAVTADEVDAVLCRSNGMCIQQAVDGLEKGRTVGFSKDPSPLKRLAWAAKELQEDGRTDHEDFTGFSAWDDVVEYSESPEGSDMKVFVKLVNRYSARRLGAILMNVKDARHTEVDLVVATAHSTKGLEWGRVRIAEDFTAPDFEAGEELKVDDAMVGYVAVTRAKTFLNHKGLEWIHTMPSQAVSAQDQVPAGV